MQQIKYRIWNGIAKKFHYDVENVFQCMAQQAVHDKIMETRGFTTAYDHISEGMCFERFTGFKANNGDIYIGDRVSVCVFFVSPANPDNDIHFLGEIKEINGCVSIVIDHYLYDSQGWLNLKETAQGFPFDPDYVEDGTYTIPLFDLCAMSGNNGEYLEENVEIVGNIHEQKQ